MKKIMLLNYRIYVKTKQINYPAGQYGLDYNAGCWI